MYVVPISQTLKGLHILQSSLANSKYFQFCSHSVKLKLSYREQNCPKNSVAYYAVNTNYTIMSQSHLPQSHVLRLFNQFLFDMFNTCDQIWGLIFLLRFENARHNQWLSSADRTSRLRTCPFPPNTSYKHRIFLLTKIQTGSYIYPATLPYRITKSIGRQCTIAAVETNCLTDHGHTKGFASHNPRLRLLLQCCPCCS